MGMETIIAINVMSKVPAKTETAPKAPLLAIWSSLIAICGLQDKPNKNSVIGTLSKNLIASNIKENTIETFNAGCNLALHCNGNIKEMEIVGKNAPLIDKFLSKKTSQFYKILR